MKKKTIPTKTLVSFVGVTEARLRQLATAGNIPAPTDGLWPHPATIQALFKFYRQRNEPKNIDAEKLRKLRAEATLAEIITRRAQGKLISVEAYANHVGTVLHTLRAGILGSNLSQAEKRDLILELQRLLMEIRDPENDQAAAESQTEPT